MSTDRINIKAANFRGGNTVVRYTITCECGCSEKAYSDFYPGKKILTNAAIIAKIAEKHTDELKPTIDEN